MPAAVSIQAAHPPRRSGRAHQPHGVGGVAQRAIGLAFLIAADLCLGAGALSAHRAVSMVSPAPGTQRGGRDLTGPSGPLVAARDQAAHVRAHPPKRRPGAARHTPYRGRPHRPAPPRFHGGPNGLIVSHPFTRPGSPGRWITEQGRRGGFIAWYGPVFWPYAYDDVFEYLLWPADDADYDGLFWDNAFAATLDPALSAASAAVAARPQALAGSLAERSRAGVRGLAGLSREFAQICGGRSPGRIGWPAERVLRTLGPTVGNEVALGAFQAAATAAAKMLDDACTDEMPTSAAQRLDAMERRLDAMRQAIAGIRPALEGLYDGLSDAQKARLDRIEDPDAEANDAKAAADAGSICGLSQPVPLPLGPEPTLPPSQAWRDALAALAEAVANAVEQLRTACPTVTPGTPPARLNVLDTRLSAMLEAVRIERPALAALSVVLSRAPKRPANERAPTRPR